LLASQRESLLMRVRYPTWRKERRLDAGNYNP
jgi:hypothetical protein